MALAACGIKIAINGSETDTDVEADSASWTTKVGNVRVTTGGGSFWRVGRPGVANIDVMVPLYLASKIRTVTIAVTCIGNPSGLPTGTIGSGSANAYRIIFHGDVQSIKGSPTSADSIVQIDAVSEMSGLLNRKARTAAAANSGIVSLLTDIETAHGLTMNGSNYFATVANGFPNCDRPAQKQNTNGSWIRTMLAGSGVNMTEDWETSITAPALRWRPDWQDTNYFSGLTSSRMWTWEAYHPWLLSYSDVGTQYGDFVARVNVEGENAAGTQHYGWARLFTAVDRALAGNRDITLDTWIDTATECQTWARRLLAYQGEPIYLKMNQLTYNSEATYRQLRDGTNSAFTSDEEYVTAFTMTAGMPGDTVTIRDPFGNTHTTAADWPTDNPDGGDLYDRLLELWSPILQYDTTASFCDFLTRAWTRTFTPTGGWDVTVGLDPIAVGSGLTGSDVSEYSSGTY